MDREMVLSGTGPWVPRRIGAFKTKPLYEVLIFLVFTPQTLVIRCKTTSLTSLKLIKKDKNNQKKMKVTKGDKEMTTNICKVMTKR